MGQLTILKLRDEASTTPRQIDSSLNDEVLNGGLMPLDLFQERVEHGSKQQTAHKS
jgi:uncharacterized protein (DUF885 family)